MSGTTRASLAGRHRRSARWLLIAAVLIATLAPFVPTFIRPDSVDAATRMIKLPATSGTSWTISQGYNTNPSSGGSHYNCLEHPQVRCSQYWTYKYSFDLVKVGGDTAGQPVLSPVTGTIRWIDDSYGGMSIDLGNGWAVAYFHTLMAPGLAAGQAIAQGQYLGSVAPPGQGGNGGFPHLHLTLWQTSDGGNWSRNAKPFVGEQALEGVDFEAISGSPANQHRGKTIVSSNTALGGGVVPPRQVAKTSPSHSASLKSTTTPTLSWNPVAGATSYEVLVDNGQFTSPWVGGTTWTTPALTAGTHSWKVRARNSAGTGTWSSTWKFTITTDLSQSELDNGAKIGTGTYRVYGTRQGMVGGRTSSGHVIVANDHFVSLPACVNITCDWLAPGSTDPKYGYVTNCGSECFVMIRNPKTDMCRVEPVLDRGPWFNVDNYWDVANKRFVNAEISRDGLGYSLAQGYTADAAARDGYDVGWGKTGAYGNTNLLKDGKNYPVAFNTSIDIGDGTWLELGFPWDPGPQTVEVTMMWQVAQSATDAELACEGPKSPPPYFTMSKSSGVPGATITINGKYYGKNENVRVYFDSASTPAIASVTTDSNGRFTTSFTVPSAVGGTHRIHAVGRPSKLRVGKDFRVLPKATSSAKSGSASLTLNLTGTNFASGEVVKVFWDANTASSATGTADASGTVKIPVRAPSVGGVHTARMVGQTNRFTARAAFTVVQRVRLTPTTTAMGASVKVYGTGWPANQTVSFRWNTKTGSVLCSAMVDSTGYSECGFRAPGSAQEGSYRIYGVDGTRSASTVYTIEGVSGAEEPSETSDASVSPTATETPDASPVGSETPAVIPTEDMTATEIPTEIPVAPTETPTPTEVPTETTTVAPEPRVVEAVAIADTSVRHASPEEAQPAESMGTLTAGGSETGVTYVSFDVADIGEGTVTEAYLQVTGSGGRGPGGTVGIIPGYIVDEGGTYLSLPTQDIGAAYALDGSVSTMGGVGPGETTSVDVTRSVQANGQYTFVILGDTGQALELSSREGAAAARLVLVIQD